MIAPQCSTICGSPAQAAAAASASFGAHTSLPFPGGFAFALTGNTTLVGAFIEGADNFLFNETSGTLIYTGTQQARVLVTAHVEVALSSESPGPFADVELGILHNGVEVPSTAGYAAVPKVPDSTHIASQAFVLIQPGDFFTLQLGPVAGPSPNVLLVLQASLAVFG